MPFDTMPVEQPVQSEELAILDGVIELLREPKHWCQGVNATGPIGARSFCLMGAVFQIGMGDPCPDREITKVVSRLLIALNRGVPSYAHGAVAFNDRETTRHADVVALLTRVRAQFQ
jgi:hypothetical protein